MARKLLNAPAASAGIVLSSAHRDYGRTGYRGANQNQWYNIFDNSRWVTLKVMKDNPYFDIDWNIGIDHQSTWNSTVYRLTMQYSTDNKSSWSSIRDTKNYTQEQTWNNSRNVCGSSRGTNVLYNPTALNLVAGNYIAFGIQFKYDGQSNRTYINQNAENHNGHDQTGADSFKGGGAFLRVREIDFDNANVTLAGTVCNGTSAV